jgi:hypothetical protein
MPGALELGALYVTYPYQVIHLLIQVRPPFRYPLPRLTSELASKPPIHLRLVQQSNSPSTCPHISYYSTCDKIPTGWAQLKKG